MIYSLDDFKGAIAGGAGLAKANLYKLVLPTIPEIYANLTGVKAADPRTMSILCKSVNMPGRQMLTVERQIGTLNQKVVYGVSNEDVTMTFVGLNDYVTRKYFEDWQHYAVADDSYLVKYKTQYARNVLIHQLNAEGVAVYGVELVDAFPVQLLNVEMSNENANPVDISVTMAYTTWHRASVRTDVSSTIT